MRTDRELEKQCTISKGLDNMKSKEECRFYSDSKCIAADLEHCDFEGENHEKCLCYRMYYLKPQTMQLR